MEEDKQLKVIFDQLPKSLETLKQLKIASLKEPYYAVGLLISAFCLWPTNQKEALLMINFLKGPEPLSTYEVQFISERLKNKEYLPWSYFEGSSPENGYKPSQPYLVLVKTVPSSFNEEGYVKYYLQSSGADSLRPVKVRQKKSTGEWYLWEQILLSEIRQPKSADKWT